jgi:hypothetical protein
MTKASRFARSYAAAATALTLLGATGPSVAAEGPPFRDQPEHAIYDLPAGMACPGFGLRLEVIGDPHRVFREYKDQNGKPLRVLHAGAGNTLVFTNLATSKTLTLRTGGSVEHITYNPDGTQTWTVTGHNVLIQFPTDVPPGPTTILYLGRLVFTINPVTSFGVIQSFNGTTTDICAALVE